MLRISVLLLAIVFMAGCGGGSMPFVPAHSGASGGGTSSSGSSGSGTSGSGSSGSGTLGIGASSSGSSGSGTSSSGSSGSGTSSSGSSGSGTSSSGSSGSGTSSSGSSDSSSSGSSSSSVTGPGEFTFSGYTWETHNGSAPPVGNTTGNVGTFDPKNVSVGSELVLSLTQTQQGGQILSSGSEVMTKQTFTYGTFEFTSRAANVLSGSDTSGFLNASNSTTEIDMEQVGNKTDAVDR